MGIIAAGQAHSLFDTLWAADVLVCRRAYIGTAVAFIPTNSV